MGSQESQTQFSNQTTTVSEELDVDPSPDDIIAAVAGKVPAHHWSKMQVTDADKAKCW